MNKQDYSKLIEETKVDRSKSELTRFAEGATLLAQLGGNSLNPDHEIIYVDGPEIENLSEEDARKLSELGFNDFNDDMGFTFFA